MREVIELSKEEYGNLMYQLRYLRENLENLSENKNIRLVILESSREGNIYHIPIYTIKEVYENGTHANGRLRGLFMSDLCSQLLDENNPPESGLGIARKMDIRILRNAVSKLINKNGNWILRMLKGKILKSLNLE